MALTVFITGASSGIGMACARAFAAQGYQLILAARRLSVLQTLALELESSYGVKSHCIELDVRDVKAVEAAVDNLPESFANIDVLINNAGLAQGMESIFEADTDDWDRMIDVNIKGLLYVSRFVVARMMKQNKGHVINIGSISSHQVYSGGNVYCATKFAVKALSRAIKMDVHGTPIRVSQIDPGLVETNYSVVRFKGDKSKADSVYQNMTPLSAEDIADAVVYCVSRPAHINIAEMLLLPTDQTCAHMVHRREEVSERSEERA